MEAYWNAKIVRCDVTRALYRVAAEVNTASLFEDFSKRMEIATAAMFASAADAEFADLAIVNMCRSYLEAAKTPLEQRSE